MSEPAKVFEDRGTPDQWRVEWFDDDGRCELEIFTGSTARRDALRYAMQKYGHFKEVQPEPYPPPRNVTAARGSAGVNCGILAHLP
jgi:hypothetical protein